MRGGMKMLLVTKAREDRRDNSGPRSAYDDGMRSAYNPSGMEGPDSRFRDRRGREHYDNGRFAPMRSAMDEPEDNYGPEGRRRRYSDGRFAPRSDHDGEEMRMGYASPYVPPVYDAAERRMNPIGFAPGGYWTEESYGMRADHSRMDEMEHRSSPMHKGGARGETDKFSREMAEEWTAQMANEDGSRGAHWTMDQTTQAMKQRGLHVDPAEFYAVMNMLYSDFCKVFKTHNISSVDVYADLAAAWIQDKDAVPGKTAAYYRCVVK